MKIALVAGIDGQILDFYENLNPSCDLVLATGGFGVWPDPNRLDKATKQKTGPGDFHKLYINGWVAPVQTIFVAGAHEDHKWLYTRYKMNNLEILPNVTLLLNGYCTIFEKGNEKVKITGLGKIYGEKTFKGEYNKKSYRHYTRREVEKACYTGPTDILLLNPSLDSPGISNIIYATNPKYTVYYHPNHPNNIPMKGVIPLDKKEIVYITL